MGDGRDVARRVTGGGVDGEVRQAAEVFCFGWFVWERPHWWGY